MRIEDPDTPAIKKYLDYSYVGLGEELSREELPQGKVKTFDYDSQLQRQGQTTKLTAAAPGSYRSFGKDANGSVEGLEDADGDIRECGASEPICRTDRYRYDPYGEMEDKEADLSEEAKDNPFRFEGFYYDSGLKSYDMRARPYRPDIGRFVTQDRFEASTGDLTLQSDALTQNRYAFAGGNPVSNVEFDGHRYYNGGYDAGGSSVEASRRNTRGGQQRPLSTRQTTTYAAAAVSYAASSAPVKRAPAPVRRAPLRAGALTPYKPPADAPRGLSLSDDVGVFGDALEAVAENHQRNTPGSPLYEPPSAKEAAIEAASVIPVFRGARIAGALYKLGSKIRGAGKATKGADEVPASAPVGSSRSPMNAAGSNRASRVAGRPYGGHALDRMQGRGITPSVVEDTIRHGISRRQGLFRRNHYSEANDLTVITNWRGRVITTGRGQYRGGR